MSSAPQASFAMLLPPGWVRLPARPDDHAALRVVIDAIIAEALPSSLPRDSAEPWRSELRKKLTATVAEAGDSGATAVYLPVREIDGVTVPASIIESEVEDESDDPPGAVILDMITNPAPHTIATRATVDGAEAVRTDTLVFGTSAADSAETEAAYAQAEGNPDQPEPVTTRQVAYMIDVPHREGRWVVLSFSSLAGAGALQQLSDALVMLFDALITTFRWTDVPGHDHTDLETRLEQIHSSH